MSRGGAIAVALLLAPWTSAAGATAPAPAARVAVAAAADLQFAFDEIGTAFRAANPDVELTVTYGSSGTFFAQLSTRAPFDLYLSADVDYPRRLVAAGLAVPDSLFRYAIGQIALWVPAASPLDLERDGIDALLAPSVRTIAIANPRHAPYGRAAEAALRTLGVYERVRARLVLGENIAQTAQFVESGAADVGIVALSLALAPRLQATGRHWLVPRDSHPPLEQGGVILEWARDRHAAERLRAFLVGPEGRRLLDRFGFLPPP